MTKPSVFAPLKKIRVKASLFVALLLVSSTLALSLITLRIMNQRILGEVIKRAETLCRAAASTAGYTLISQDLLGLDNLVYRIKSSSPDIAYMAVVNREGKILVHSDTKKAGEPFRPELGKALQKAVDGTTVSEIAGPVHGMIEVETPIVFLEKSLGSIVLAVNRASVFEAQKEAKRKILAVFGILLLAGVAGSLALTSILTRPIRELSTGVAQLSLELGRDLGLDAAQLEQLEIASLFHDVGKIKIPDSILLKKDKLDLTEQREMKRHPEYGAEILSKAGSLLCYIPAVKHHHECFDGSGYPDGLSGNEIPLAAAIIGLADMYDAMTSDRPYRDRLSDEEAQAEIAGLAQNQFDPALAGRFVALLKKRTTDALPRQGE